MLVVVGGGGGGGEEAIATGVFGVGVAPPCYVTDQ